jgi:uncharacterized membrane protein
MKRSAKMRNKNSFELNFYKLFWIFFIGCFLGVFVETIWCLLIKHTIESRSGLIYGPFNPVYGFGALLITICLFKIRYKRNHLVFICSMVIGIVFEYMCSLFQEITFGTVSWEYSRTFLNLGGRTNLLYGVLWGILGLAWVKVLLPVILMYIERIPKRIGMILTSALFIFMFLNITLSGLAIYRQSQRYKGNPATNSLTRFIDKKYTDAYLKRIYPNMILVEKKRNNKEK